MKNKIGFIESGYNIWKKIDNEEIKGKNFTGQSLSKPLPETKKEMDEYLDSIIGFLLKRAEMMDKSLQ